MLANNANMGERSVFDWPSHGDTIDIPLNALVSSGQRRILVLDSFRANGTGRSGLDLIAQTA